MLREEGWVRYEYLAPEGYIPKRFWTYSGIGWKPWGKLAWVSAKSLEFESGKRPVGMVLQLTLSQPKEFSGGLCA